jgi:uncharacterized protein
MSDFALRHRSTIVDMDTGVVIEETYRLDGRLHRDQTEGPAQILRRSDSGQVTSECYYWNGRLHREDGPAQIHYRVDTKKPYAKGYPYIIGYYRHGKLHRDQKEGPARIECYRGVVVEEHYAVHNKVCRDPEDGPCHISRNGDGSIAYSRYSEPSEAPFRGKTSRRNLKSGKDPSP